MKKATNRIAIQIKFDGVSRAMMVKCASQLEFLFCLFNLLFFFLFSYYFLRRRRRGVDGFSQTCPCQKLEKKKQTKKKRANVYSW